MSDCEDHVYETAGERRGGYETAYCGENVYQTKNGRSAAESGFKTFPLPLTKNVKGHADESLKNRSPRCRLIIAIAVAISIIIALLVALLVQLNVSIPDHQQEDRTSTTSGRPGENEQTTTSLCVTTSTSTTETTPVARSCLEIKGRGVTTDGIYDVKPDDNFDRSQTYCDMTTDGGGWTLVASIHEKDITKKCHPDDIWSTYQYVEAREVPVKSNWENEMTFGNVQRSTTADFKHAGFFTMDASDIMVWHVPNDVTTNLWKERSTLRYRTNDKFLKSNGGNIGAIYKDKYPLTVASEYAFTAMVLDALSAKGGDITKILSNFYNYTYSQSGYSNVIPDTNMYASSFFGNRVTFGGYRCSFRQVDYGTYHKCPGLPTSFGTKKSRPFFAAAAILNANRRSPYYYIHLDSQRPYADTNEEITLLNATMTKGNLKLQYGMTQYRSSTYATIGEFFFVVSNEKDWGSVEPTRFYRSNTNLTWYSSFYEYEAEGYPANIILGYTLLAISSGGVITKEQADKVGEKILDAIAPLDTLFVGAGPPGLYAPVVFDKGSNEEVMNMVPPNMHPYSEPGFLQFRAYNASGYPSAFCPGIKVFSLYPEYACVGSVSNSVEDYGTCGDFAGWGGTSTDAIQSNRPNASGLAHSYKDILSTILIFQR